MVVLSGLHKYADSVEYQFDLADEAQFLQLEIVKVEYFYLIRTHDSSSYACTVRFRLTYGYLCREFRWPVD